MARILILLAISLFVITAEGCRAKNGCGAPGITHSSRGGGLSAGPGISRSGGGGMGHTPSISGPRRRGNSMSGPTRQHGKR